MPNLEHVYVYTYEVRLLRASIIHANLGQCTYSMLIQYQYYNDMYVNVHVPSLHDSNLGL